MENRIGCGADAGAGAGLEALGVMAGAAIGAAGAAAGALASSVPVAGAPDTGFSSSFLRTRSPWPLVPNRSSISLETSMTFWSARREKAADPRLLISSLRGTSTSLLSLSVAFGKMPAGESLRIRPNGTRTAPCESWATNAPRKSLIVASEGMEEACFVCNSLGIPCTRLRREICRDSPSAMTPGVTLSYWLKSDAAAPEAPAAERVCCPTDDEIAEDSAAPEDLRLNNFLMAPSI